MFNAQLPSRSFAPCAASLLVAGLVTCAPVKITTTQEDAMPEDSVVYRCDFNDAIPGGPVPEVIDDSKWAGGKAKFRVIDGGDPARGNLLEAQIVGFGQIAIGDFGITPGKAYRVSATISARGAHTIDFTLRRTPAPYTTHGSTTEQVYESPRRVSFLVREARDGNPVRVQIVIRGHTTLTIDDVLVEEITGELPPENAADPLAMLLPDPQWPRGNLLANSSFEAGTDGWLPYRGRWGSWAPERSDDALDGSHVLRMKEGFGVATPFIRLPIRHESTIAARVRAIDGPAKVRLGFGDYVDFRGGDQFPKEDHEVSPSDGWKRVLLTFKPECPKGQLAPWLEFYGTIDCIEGTILLDAAEVRHLSDTPGDAPYARRTELEFAVRTDMPFGVATRGQKATATLMASQPGAACRLRMLDEEGREVKAWDVETTDGLATVDLGTPECGVWRLTTSSGPSAAHEGIEPPSRIEGESLLLVVPPMPDVPLKKWPFGSHVREDADMIEACWKLGWRWMRQHDVPNYGKWGYVQPNSAEDWNFKTDDWRFVRRSGHAVLTNIDQMPRWAPQDHSGKYQHFRVFTDSTVPPFREYCRRLAIDAKGLADEYEVCNEVCLSGIPAEDYMRILRTAHEGLKEGDPDAQIVGLGGAVPQESEWMYRCIELGAGKYSDAVSFHGYGFTNNAQNRGPEPLIDCVKRIREALAKAGTPDVRVYDTEAGFIIRSSLTKHYLPLGDADPREAGKALAKAVAAVVASGLDRWMYYASFDQVAPGQGAAFCASEIGRLMKPSHQPMAVAISLLTGLEYEGREPADDGVVHLVFAGRGKRVHMLWCPDREVSASVPVKTRTVLNTWGREVPVSGNLTLDASPVYCLAE